MSKVKINKSYNILYHTMLLFYMIYVVRVTMFIVKCSPIHNWIKLLIIDISAN